MSLAEALLVAVVGGLGASLLTHFLRTHSDDRRRWHAERRSVYARFLRACSDTRRLVVDIAAEGDDPLIEWRPGSFRVPAAAAENRLYKLEQDREEANAELRLIASKSVIEAADDLGSKTLGIVTIVRGVSQLDPGDLIKGWNAAHSKFEAAARKELGA